MDIITLKNTQIDVSRFIFGTSSLFKCGSAKKRARLLCSAVEAGFTHFDTAPYYGFGSTERDISKILKAYPNLTITSKVGLYSPGGETQSDSKIFFRKVFGRLFRPISQPEIDFSLKRATLSLEGSLRRLNSNVIDIYTLHEPRIELLNTDEWSLWLEKIQREGKVRSVGLALTAERLKPFLDTNSSLTEFIQMQDSLERHDADILGLYNKPLQITYGYVSEALANKSKHSVPEILKQALRRNPLGAIIVSTSKSSRLTQYNKIIEATKSDL